MHRIIESKHIKISKAWGVSLRLIVYAGLLCAIAIFNVSNILGSDATSDAKDFASNLYSNQCESIATSCYFEGLYLYQKYLSVFTGIFGQYSGACLSVFANITVLVVLLNKYRKALNTLISKTPLILIALLSPATLLYFTAPLRETLKVIVSLLIIECLISLRDKHTTVLSLALNSIVLTLLVLLYSGTHKTSIVIVAATLASWCLTLMVSICPTPKNNYKVNQSMIYLVLLLIPLIVVLVQPVSTLSSIMFQNYLGENSMTLDTPLMYSYAIISPADALSRLILFAFPLKVVATINFLVILIDSLGFVVVLYLYIRYLPSFTLFPRLKIALVNCWLISYYAIYSLSSGNYGTAMRHRLSLSWMIIFIMCIYLEKESIKGNEQLLK